MELHDALAQIRQIRIGLQRSQRFEGYRAVPTAASGMLAALVGAAQANWVPDAAARPVVYVSLWVGCATACAIAAGVSLSIHCRRDDSGLSRWRAREALLRLLPSFTAGALLTLTLIAVAPNTVWILPGIWQILFSLGLFASAGLLPAGIPLVAAAYLASGVACVSLGGDALSPLAMSVPFLVGQSWIACLLHLDQERHDGRTT